MSFHTGIPEPHIRDRVKYGYSALFLCKDNKDTNPQNICEFESPYSAAAITRPPLPMLYAYMSPYEE